MVGKPPNLHPQNDQFLVEKPKGFCWGFTHHFVRKPSQNGTNQLPGSIGLPLPLLPVSTSISMLRTPNKTIGQTNPEKTHPKTQQVFMPEDQNNRASEPKDIKACRKASVVPGTNCGTALTLVVGGVYIICRNFTHIS